MAIIPADEKVFMVDKRTNTTYGGSQALQDMQQWYTMQDVADSVQPYKVFSALLTQNSGSNPQQITSGGLTIGVTYRIFSNVNADFTNVGAPNNDQGTYFIATGTTPNWGDSEENILEFDPGAPMATVLENTIGNIWFNFADTGFYNIVSSNLFTGNKTWYTTGIVSSAVSNGYLEWRNPANFRLFTFISGGPADNALSLTPIEIRVYN